jgi:hypothetical protein
MRQEKRSESASGGTWGAPDEANALEAGAPADAVPALSDWMKAGLGALVGSIIGLALAVLLRMWWVS